MQATGAYTITRLLIISYTFVVKLTLINTNYVSMEITFNSPVYFIGYLQLLLHNLINIILSTVHMIYCVWLQYSYEVNVH